MNRQRRVEREAEEYVEQRKSAPRRVVEADSDAGERFTNDIRTYPVVSRPHPQGQVFEKATGGARVVGVSLLDGPDNLPAPQRKRDREQDDTSEPTAQDEVLTPAPKARSTHVVQD